MLKQSEIITTLTDVGLSNGWINQYLIMTAHQQQRALGAVREQLLHEIHQTQAALECLDYLRYQLK